MKVSCPRCSTQIPAADMNVESGWAKCLPCNKLFPLAELASKSEANAWAAGVETKPARPFHARALLERTDTDLLIHFPAEGMRFETSRELLIGIVSLGFVGFGTVNTIGKPGKELLLLFLIPFWVVSFAIMAKVAWRIWGTTSVQINHDGLRMISKCHAWKKTRVVPLDQLRLARVYRSNMTGFIAVLHAVEVVLQSGSIVLSTDDEHESQWLSSEINDFLHQMNAERESTRSQSINT